ncbi:hypothetical protein EV360DRAFT_73850 [Lentinula raphanica]|nr:hypothetical protein EV360DRAFT_73850 [Lentinula raphanica]
MTLRDSRPTLNHVFTGHLISDPHLFDLEWLLKKLRSHSEIEEMETNDGEEESNRTSPDQDPFSAPPDLDPQATPTQRKAHTKQKKRQLGKSASAASEKPAPRMTRAASRARSDTASSGMASSEDDDPGTSHQGVKALLEPLEQAFDNRLMAFEKKITEANSKALKELMESNNRLISGFKTAQSEVIETSIKNAVASGVGEGLAPLTESLKTLDKNQRIQSELLMRLGSRLDQDRSRSRSSSRPSGSSTGNTAPNRDRNTDATSGPSAKQKRPFEEENEDEDGDPSGQESDDDREGETKSPKRNRKATKTKKELVLQDNIRNWLNDLIGGQQYCLDVTVTAEEVTDFEAVFLRDPVAKPCTLDDFRYCVNGKPTSAWNKGAAFVFVDYVKHNKLMKVPDKKTYDLLRKGFMIRIRTLHGYYLKSKFPKEKRDENTRKGRKYGRKSTIFYQRRELLNSLDPLRKYLRYFDLLGIVGMSSDEEEEEDVTSNPPKYKVMRPLWRGSDVEDFFRWLDACHILVRMPNDSPTGARYSQGAPPRFRIRTSQDSDNQTFVKGLPRNFYRAEWLEEKEPGWAKGGEGMVNLIVCPTSRKELIFPTELKDEHRKIEGPANSNLCQGPIPNIDGIAFTDAQRKIILKWFKGCVLMPIFYGGVPRLVDIISAIPDDDKRTLLPKLKAWLICTASGIAVVAVMCKPHQCPHIAMASNIYTALVDWIQILIIARKVILAMNLRV